MLRHEDWVSTKGRLLAVVRRSGGRQSASNQLLRLHEHSFHSAPLDVPPLGRAEVKPATKRGTRQGDEQFIEAAHSEL